MTAWAYYNEIDEYAAAWLRNLIAAGHIAPGEVDTRSIEDVHPADLEDFAQCHFFAGVGVWSLALRRAGWPDDRPVWTGSCPCQPFSAAGKGAGFADERHLWPAFFHLIRERRPAGVLGEQVASKDADPWIDLVQDDLEGLGYRVGAIPFPSAGVGAPHIRDRLYWAAHAGQGQRGSGRTGSGKASGAHDQSSGLRLVGGLAHADGGNSSAERQQRRGQQRQQSKDSGRGLVAPVGLDDPFSVRFNACGVDYREHDGVITGAADQVCGMANPASSGRREERANTGWSDVRDRAQGIATGLVDGGSDLRSGPTNGYWRDADWLGCRDGKWRPVEPGTFPLAHGAASRVGRLRAYGNAINAEAARVWVECVMQSMDEKR